MIGYFVPGGEGKDRVRSRLAVERYHAEQGIVLLTGHKPGRLERCLTSESWSARDFLRGQGIPLEDIRIEDKSQDTLGNFYFARKEGLLEGITSLHVVTETYHAPRCCWLGERLLDVPIIDAGDCGLPTLKQRMQERFLLGLLQWDFKQFNLIDASLLDEYMEHHHPFSGDTPKGAYARFVLLGAKTQLF